MVSIVFNQAEHDWESSVTGWNTTVFVGPRSELHAREGWCDQCRSYYKNCSAENTKEKVERRLER